MCTARRTGFGQIGHSTGSSTQHTHCPSPYFRRDGTTALRRFGQALFSFVSIRQPSTAGGAQQYTRTAIDQIIAIELRFGNGLISELKRLPIPILSIALMMQLAIAAEVHHHTFTSGNHIITMDMRFFDHYVGQRLVFRDDRKPSREICLVDSGETGACPDHFVGAVATVKLTVRGLRGRLRCKTSIREHVVVIGQSPDLPARPPFDKTQVLTSDTISDVQAFGYDESDIGDRERVAERQKARERSWRLCRQELYLNDETKPFAIITWRYTIDAIEILRVQDR